MSIYIFSLLVGYVQNGVDNAQGRRAQYIKDLEEPVKYVYTDLPTSQYIQRYLDVGIDYRDMVCSYLLLAGNEHIGADRINEIPIYSHNNKMIACEYYTNRLIYRNYYIHDENNHPKLAKTAIYKSDGVVAFDVFYDQGKPSYYLFPDGEICNKYEFYVKYFKSLNLTEKDTILIDRPSQLDYIQPLLENKGNARTIVFLHSGHYFEHNEDPGYNYLNPEYFSWFKNSKLIDDIVVSTSCQKDDLVSNLIGFGCKTPRITVIPACGIEKIIENDSRKRYSIISVGRHSFEKRLDLSIKSVIEAHKKIPDVTLDIYGPRSSSGYTEELERIIYENDASDYIKIKGFRDLTDTYKEYELFLTTSLKETLGLGTLEAIASGDAVVGFDAVYGNKELIIEDYNGKRVPIDYDQLDNEIYVTQLIKSIADEIVDILTDSSKLMKYRENSYQVAEKYLDSVIATKWVNFLL